MNDISRTLQAEAAAVIRRFPGKAVAIDSRKVACGGIFIAVSGVNFEGKDFIGDAVANGAGVIVYSGELSERLPGVEYIQVSNTRKIVSYFYREFFGCPDDALKLYAATGTNGKTTSAYLLRALLENAGYRCGLFSTVSYHDGSRELPSSRTTPDAVEFFDLLAEMKKNQVQFAAMESSSHSLEQHRVDAAAISGAIFTNLTGDHLDYHKNMENYFAAKVRLFTELLKDGGTAAVNLDDPYGRKLAEILGGAEKIAGFGSCDYAAYRIVDPQIKLEGVTFDLVHGNESIKVVSSLVGSYNIHNLAGVLTLLWAEGFAPELLERAVRAPFQVPGRLEMVETVSAGRCFVDYAHTDDALSNVLSTVKPFVKGKLITVFGCGGDRDHSKRPRMGKAAAEYADEIILTNDNPRSEDPEQIIADIVSGIPENVEFRIIPDREAALTAAVRSAGADDVVIVAGKGHEDYQEISGVRYHFDDREVLRNIGR